MAEPNPAQNDSLPVPVKERNVEGPGVIERGKEGTHSHSHSPKHHEETHGTSDDIDEDTPVDEVKGPGVFHRIKEEIEAIVEAIHPHKEPKNGK